MDIFLSVFTLLLSFRFMNSGVFGGGGFGASADDFDFEDFSSDAFIFLMIFQTSSFEMNLALYRFIVTTGSCVFAFETHSTFT